MDEGMLDGQASMTKFVNLIASEPDIAKVTNFLIVFVSQSDIAFFISQTVTTKDQSANSLLVRFDNLFDRAKISMQCIDGCTTPFSKPIHRK